MMLVRSATKQFNNVNFSQTYINGKCSGEKPDLSSRAILHPTDLFPLFHLTEIVARDCKIASRTSSQA